MIYQKITADKYDRLQDKSGAYNVRSYCGAREWYLDGKLHREGGHAAINSDYYQIWYKEGKRHRADGPAYYIFDKGDYYLNGINYSKEEWFSKLTPEQRAVALSNQENF